MIPKKTGSKWKYVTCLEYNAKLYIILQIFLESKLSPDISVVDFRVWMERISKDVLCHAVFAFVVHKVSSMLMSSSDTY